MTVMDNTHILDEAFERFARTGPEFGPGLSNHGPMGSEALVVLGRGHVVEEWAGWYAPRLRDAVSSRNPIAADGWREALGEIERVGDWVAFFQRALEEAPWQAVLDEWTARLAPGVMATHGVLRTAHAVRALEGGVTPARLHELAEGLGYWAARYQELPGRHVRAGKLGVAQALAHVERLGPGANRNGLFKDVIDQVGKSAPFEHVIDLVSVDVPFGEFISDLTGTFVREYLANASHASIAFIHTVTAPSALRLIEPHVSAESSRAVMAYMWQSCAAMHAAYSFGASPAMPDEAGVFDEDDLIDRAVAARDEHTIKFTEACLREHRLTGDPAFIAAVRDVVDRLRA
jgi:hypothetical protein